MKHFDPIALIEELLSRKLSPRDRKAVESLAQELDHYCAEDIAHCLFAACLPDAPLPDAAGHAEHLLRTLEYYLAINPCSARVELLDAMAIDWLRSIASAPPAKQP